MSGDLSFALRWLRKSPAFSLAAIGTIALGIGVNTAVFSVVHALLLKPLPYAAPDQLVMVWQDMRERGGPPDEWATPGNFVDWRAQTATFSAVASIRGWLPALTGLGEAEMLRGEQVTEAYFDVLRAQPVKGRAFRPDEAVPNAPRVAIISHRAWQTRFGGRDDVLGQQMTLGGEPHEIVGVMGPDFRPIIVTSAEVWRPDRLNLANPSRGAIVLRVVARLKSDVTTAQASAALGTLAKDLERQYPESNAKVGFRIVPLHEQVVGNVRPGVLVLFGAVVLVLLIACVNIANLLLARAAGRTREMAVRTALGAGRARVVRQLLTESLVLAVIGGAAGIVLSVWGLKALVAIAPAGTPRLAEVSLDPVVLAVAAGLTVLTGLLFGLVPALQMSRVNHAPALKDGGRGSVGSSGQRVRRLLIVGEIGVALMLLVGGGLLLRSFVALQQAPLGFDPSNVLVGSMSVPPQRFRTAEERIAFQDRVLERVSNVTGVTRAALTSILPLNGGDSDMDFTIEGAAPPPPDQPGPVTWYRVVSADYLRAMGMTATRGRLFDGREPAPVVVISETLASRHWPGADPVGRRVRFGDQSPWFTIAGVVADIKQQGARGEPRGQTFIPYWHTGPLPDVAAVVVLKTSVPPESLARSLGAAIRELDPTIPVSNVVPMTQLIAQSVDEPRFLALITGVFATLALLLAAIGVYGVMAYAVTLRRPEIGVRLALGARRADVFRLVYADGLKLAVMGLVLGAAGAAALAPALTTLLYGIEPLDAVTFAATAAVLLAVATVAVLIPAYRATRVDPAVTLRGD